MTFKEFKTIQLRRTKVWLWYKWLGIETWWAKKYGKKYTNKEELFKDLES
jgi:hypothetical protein